MDSQTITNTTGFIRLTALLKHALRRCHLCESTIKPAAEGFLCNHCWTALPWIQHRCAHCGLPTAIPVKRCGSCLHETNHYNRCVSPLAYEYPVNYLINSFKSGNKQSQKGLLASLMIVGLNEFDLHDWDGVIAVPQHSKRQWQRGFNHSHTLARVIAKHLNIPMVKGFKQTHAHPPQKLLTRAQRQQNLKTAFAMTRPLGFKNLLLIDDVVTTGATVEAASRVLKQSGAIKVDVLALARTPKPKR